MKEGSGRMTEIAEFERRISYALERAMRGVETLSLRKAEAEAALAEALEAAAAPAPQPAPEAPSEPPEAETVGDDIPEALRNAAAAQANAAHEAELARLREALEAERMANAQLSERVRAIREKQETTLSTLEKRLAQTTRSFDAAQADLARLKRANTDLAEANRALLEAGADLAPHLLNRAMQAELEALRAARAAEVKELNDILGSIEPILAAQDAMGGN
jgi:DNA repair exonuclease SbcCD ATPase subunit